MEYKILWNQHIDNGVVKTTHPKITYDSLIDVFIVDLGNGTWCEVYGTDRFKMAVQIADRNTL